MYTHILHATDLNNNHYKMCQQAVAIAARFSAKLYLLHVIEPPASLQLAQGLGFAEFDNPNEIKNDAEAVMNMVGEALNIPIEQQFVKIGSIKQHVLDLSANLACNLIILGRHTPTHLPSLLDSTAHYILQEANCDVLTLQGND